jgi:hypothetical protein
MSLLRIETTVGAGDDFLATVVKSVADGDSVMVQVAGEYGHLIIDAIEVIEDDE